MSYPDPQQVSRLMREAEADYNLRARHPEREQVYADYALRSHRLRAERGCVLLRYGEAPRCTIDWFGAAPAAGARAPLLVFFHGGFWRGGDKATFSFIAEHFLDAGVAVALVGYPLAPVVSVTQIVLQAQAALRHLFDQADSLGFDRGRVTASGHSAGGHLSALLGAADAAALGGNTLAGVIGLSGLYALQAFLLSSVNLETRMTLAEAELLSPIGYERFSARRFLLAVGERETDGFIQQTRHFSDRLHALGHDHGSMACPARTHFDIFEDLVSPESPLFKAMLTLITA